MRPSETAPGKQSGRRRAAVELKDAFARSIADAEDHEITEP